MSRGFLGRVAQALGGGYANQDLLGLDEAVEGFASVVAPGEFVMEPRPCGLDRVELRGLGFEGFLDWGARRGECVVPAAQAHVDLFVRVALGVELLRRGGTLLHAAAVVRDDFGVAFSGPSGAGKSTVAEISRAAGLTVLSDEMIAFVLGHELAHHYLGYTGCANGQPIGPIPNATKIDHIATAVAPFLNQPNEAASDQWGVYNLLDAGLARSGSGYR